LINSPGGELQAAFALIEVMEASKIPVETIALGQCVSAAMLILMSGTPGYRVITRTCASMSHTYSTDVGGNHWDIKEIQRELQNTQDRILDQYMKCTGLQKQKIIKNLIGKSDRWLNPAQVVEYGIADRIGALEF
jgi:ATP-dependent Clp protease protease subunit